MRLAGRAASLITTLAVRRNLIVLPTSVQPALSTRKMPRRSTARVGPALTSTETLAVTQQASATATSAHMGRHREQRLGKRIASMSCVQMRMKTRVATALGAAQHTRARLGGL